MLLGYAPQWVGPGVNSSFVRNHYEQDLCFYNFSCLRPLNGFLPFNTVFSNISYVAAGLSTFQGSRIYLSSQASSSSFVCG